MQKTLRRKIFKWVRWLLLIYVVIGVALYFFQEKLLFHPVALPFEHKYNIQVPFKEINLPINNDRMLGIVQFTVDSAKPKGVVLYFHGNMVNIERYAPFAKNFTSHQYEVWMLDYPGFGKSTGERTEKTMTSDAIELYKMALARFSADSIIIYGKSMGTGPATFLASRRDCKRLLLESPYYSIDDLMGHYAFMYPTSLISKFHFPSFEYLPEVDAPITMFHGKDDDVIPYSQAKRLLIVAPKGAELVTLEDGGHNNLNDYPLFHQKLDSLLQ
jgi:pimeloyl-ACP methyl ester carboxylesterase